MFRVVALNKHIAWTRFCKKWYNDSMLCVAVVARLELDINHVGVGDFLYIYIYYI